MGALHMFIVCVIVSKYSTAVCVWTVYMQLEQLFLIIFVGLLWKQLFCIYNAFSFGILFFKLHLICFKINCIHLVIQDIIWKIKFYFYWWAQHFQAPIPPNHLQRFVFRRNHIIQWVFCCIHHIRMFLGALSAIGMVFAPVFMFCCRINIHVYHFFWRLDYF